LIETPQSGNLPYFEALGAVLEHELVHSSSGAEPGGTAVRGGLAA
jgi:hypothetical protein